MSKRTREEEIADQAQEDNKRHRVTQQQTFAPTAPSSQLVSNTVYLQFEDPANTDKILYEMPLTQGTNTITLGRANAALHKAMRFSDVVSRNHATVSLASNNNDNSITITFTNVCSLHCLIVVAWVFFILYNI